MNHREISTAALHALDYQTAFSAHQAAKARFLKASAHVYLFTISSDECLDHLVMENAGFIQVRWVVWNELSTDYDDWWATSKSLFSTYQDASTAWMEAVKSARMSARHPDDR